MGAGPGTGQCAAGAAPESAPNAESQHPPLLNRSTGLVQDESVDSVLMKPGGPVGAMGAGPGIVQWMPAAAPDPAPPDRRLACPPESAPNAGSQHPPLLNSPTRLVQGEWVDPVLRRPG